MNQNSTAESNVTDSELAIAVVENGVLRLRRVGVYAERLASELAQ